MDVTALKSEDLLAYCKVSHPYGARIAWAMLPFVHEGDIESA
jgi:hypothetical protein